MTDDKIEVVRAYLTRKFPGATIEHRNDRKFHAQAFKIVFKGDSALLKVSDEVLGDNSEQQILRLFDRKAVADVLAKDTNLGVFLISAELTTFER
jgi:hypothetical protein